MTIVNTSYENGLFGAGGARCNRARPRIETERQALSRRR